jgi:hypothetical protein
LVEAPVATLTDAAWACILLAALVATWWAAGRNALYLQEQYQNGWKYLVPFWYATRTVGMLLVLAVDLWLVAALVAVLS